jgi:primosomal protein N'
MVKKGSAVAQKRSVGPQPGDRVRFRFGTRTIEGVVTSVRGDTLHVSVQLDGADDLIDRFVRADDLVPA